MTMTGEGDGNGFRSYRKGFSFLLLASLLIICIVWDIAGRDGVVQFYSPSILPYIQNASVPRDVSSSDINITRTALPPVTSTTAKLVNPHNFQYVFQGNSTCVRRNNTDVYLLICVCVAPANFKHREVIRNTWGSITKYNLEVRLIFLIAKTKNETTQSKINNESKEYNDIVQEDFVDSYRNLSLKSVAMLRWAMSYCNSAKYVLKADDDMFINVPYLIGVLKHKHITNSVIGMLIQGARPIHNPASKWHTPQELYKEAVYPPYLSGTAYVISGDIVSKLFHASQMTPLFWLEDVYITGLCRRKIGANAVADYGFTYSHRSPTGCAYQHIITGHDNTLEEIEKIWRELQDPNMKC
ncbi:beta-1,3-galactosyltransferase 1-like [Pecten maximus]|uniref:beta-1,3-galactosyltransferase 1-like n=1 Tax=Pecten maximus TaxID=6579 RepID=UPI001458875B|nr:beta-1,3-galactosyltransferase 1-like [Pecten maximus]XP_033748122.1 beta-1,3-galactosyltransferase 1-like [Pecten maximus]